MGQWDSTASDLLAAVVASGVAVDRAEVRPGPSFAVMCRLLAVHLDSTREVTGAGGEFGMSFSATRLDLVVTFADDCVPSIDDSVTPPKLPDAAAVNAWSTSMLADAERVHDAILGWQDVTQCGEVSVGAGTPFGPSGTIAGWRWPVGVVLLT